MIYSVRKKLDGGMASKFNIKRINTFKIKTLPHALILPYLGCLIALSKNELFYHKNYYLHGEISILESIQLIIIFSCLYILAKNRRNFLIHFNKCGFLAKISLFSFLLYEEISWITSDTIMFFSSINEQNEINFHNLAAFNQLNIVEARIPLINIEASISLTAFTYSFALLFIGFGSYLKPLNRIKFLFLDKKYSFYFTVYTLPLAVNSIANQYAGNDILPTLHPELLELFVYSIFLLDILHKRRSIKDRMSQSLVTRK